MHNSIRFTNNRQKTEHAHDQNISGSGEGFYSGGSRLTVEMFNCNNIRGNERVLMCLEHWCFVLHNIFESSSWNGSNWPNWWRAGWKIGWLFSEAILHMRRSDMFFIPVQAWLQSSPLTKINSARRIHSNLSRLFKSLLTEGHVCKTCSLFRKA